MVSSKEGLVVEKSQWSIPFLPTWPSHGEGDVNAVQTMLFERSNLEMSGAQAEMQSCKANVRCAEKRDGRRCFVRSVGPFSRP